MTTNTEREPFVDAQEAGKFLCLRPRRVLELARQGEIPAYPLGQGKRRVWRFHTTIAGYKRILKNRCIDRWGKRTPMGEESSTKFRLALCMTFRPNRRHGRK